METFWFFWLRFRRAYDSTYDSDFLFSLGHKCSYDFAYDSDSDSDSVTSENQCLFLETLKLIFHYYAGIVRYCVDLIKLCSPVPLHTVRNPALDNSIYICALLWPCVWFM